MADAAVDTATEGLKKTYEQLGQGFQILGTPTEITLGGYTHDHGKYDAYWYHSDHLGSSSYISNRFGKVSQHMEYLPFGETLVDEHLNSYNSPFKFNGKELDDETGNYYMSARYYDPKWSMWLSVDPLAEKYASWSSYNYTFSNPVRFTDPTGMGPETVIIKGKLAEKTVEQLNASTSLEITRDKKTGKLSATGEAKTEHDQQLLNAINDEKITVVLKATKQNKVKGRYIFGDSFEGSLKKRNDKVLAKQIINPNQAEIIENFAEMQKGSIAKHAILEAFFGAKNDPGAYPQQRDAYLRAHGETNTIYPDGDYGRIAEEKEIRREYIKNGRRQILNLTKVGAGTRVY